MFDNVIFRVAFLSYLSLGPVPLTRWDANACICYSPLIAANFAKLLSCSLTLFVFQNRAAGSGPTWE